MLGARLLVGASLVAIVAACQAGPSSTTGPSASPQPASAGPASTAAPASTPTPTTAPSAAADAIVVTVDVTGGECANGPCGAQYVIRNDGSIDGPEGAPSSIPAELAEEIAALAASADWDAVRAVPFTGECPTAFDGQKHVYTFPAETGALVFDSCEFDLGGVEVFTTIDAALFGGA
jgi:hypothetical protein